MYFGIGVGASINNDKFTASAHTTSNIVTVTSNNTYALANAFLGYGHTFINDLYLGAEVNIYTPRTVEFNNRPAVTVPGLLVNDKYTINDNVAMDLLPGYRFNSNFLFYGRLGAAFRLTNFNQQPVTDSSQAIADSTHSVDGRFGVGVTYALNKKFAASVDYFYSYAPTFGTYVPLRSAQHNFNSFSNYIGVSFAYTV